MSALPARLTQLLSDLDRFVAAEIAPLQQQDDNQRFFDHRREFARTGVENGGVPRREWEELLAEARRRADAPASTATPCPGSPGGAVSASPSPSPTVATESVMPSSR